MWGKKQRGCRHYYVVPKLLICPQFTWATRGESWNHVQAFSEPSQVAASFSAEDYSRSRVPGQREREVHRRSNNPYCEIAERIVPEIATEEWPDSTGRGSVMQVTLSAKKHE